MSAEASPPPPCVACEIVSGRFVPPGGVVARWPGFHLHAVAGPTPVRGWLVLSTERHVRGLYDLDDADAARLGVLAATVERAQREALGAEHVYTALFAEVVTHLHVHLIPRYADTPARIRGPNVFLAPPEDALPLDVVRPAVEAVARALAAAPPPGDDRRTRL